MSSRTRAARGRFDKFPGDPRFEKMKIFVTDEDLDQLSNNEMLSTRLLDCLLQQAAPPPLLHDDFATYLGGFGSKSYFETSNEIFDKEETSRTIADKRRINAIQSSVAFLRPREDKSNGTATARAGGRNKKFNDEGNKKGQDEAALVIPVIDGRHFYVLIFYLKLEFSDNYFGAVYCYDSLRRRSTRLNADSPVAKVVKQVERFFRNFVLFEKENVAPPTTTCNLQKVAFPDCPKQSNSVDCGLFCLGFVLHFLYRVPLNSKAFEQRHCTALRGAILNHLENIRSGLPPDMASTAGIVVCNCFPNVLTSPRAMLVLEKCGADLEDVTPIEIRRDGQKRTSESRTASLKKKLVAESLLDESKHAQSLGKEDNDEPVHFVDESDSAEEEAEDKDLLDHEEEEDDDVEVPEEEMNDYRDDKNDDRDDDTAPADTLKSSSVSSDLTTDEDNIFSDVLKGHGGINAQFVDLNDIEPLIEEYEARTGNGLAILRSKQNKFRLYHCVAHKNCPFELYFGRTRGNGTFTLKRYDKLHACAPRDATASGGRSWKQRRAGKLCKVVLEVGMTKDARPKPADVMKTAATKFKFEIPYMTAWRALNQTSSSQQIAAAKNFQAIIPFMNKLAAENPGSVIGYERDDEKRLNQVYFFPKFMNNILQFVRPVISLDAAHLKSAYKGTLFVASVLSGANDVYPIGFMISNGNEDRQSWTTFLQLLKEAFPTIIEQGYNNHNGGEEIEFPFIFISDRDKGLQPALEEVFPQNIPVSCARHIEANVAQRFGKECSKFVCTIAKTMSIRYESELFDKICAIKPEAATYLQDITDLWKGTTWLDQELNLPPRYGIVTSNTSECVNNMLGDARPLGWLEAIEKIVDILTTRIHKCRQKYTERDPNEVVPRVAQLLKVRWDAAASITVMELEQGCGDFKVSEPGILQEQDHQDENLPNMPFTSLTQQKVHIVKPDLKYCTCGTWQDMLFPCRHACAVYRKHLRKEFSYVQECLVHRFYLFDSVKSLFKTNINPVCLEHVHYDGETKPPYCSKRQPGRPKSKRFRRRSEFLNAEDSKIKCGMCNQRGHNSRTCERRNQEHG